MTNAKLFRFLWNLKIAQSYNMVIYWLQKIPWLGNLISGRAYRGQSAKIVLRFLGIIRYVLTPFFNSFLYLLVLSGVSVVLEKLDYAILDKVQNFWLLLLVFSLFIGSAIKASLINNDKDSILAVKIFRLTARHYYLFQLLILETLYLVSFSFGLMWFCHFMGEPLTKAWCFTLLTLGVRVLLRYAILHLYQLDKTEPAKRPVAVMITISGFAPILGVLLFLIGYTQPLAWITSQGAGLLGFFLILVSSYLLWRTPLIDKIAERLLLITELKTTDQEAVATADLQVKEADYDLSSLADRAVSHRTTTGITYLNQIFYDRVGPHLKKKMQIRKTIISVLMVAGVGLTLWAVNFADLDKPGTFTELLPYVFPFSLAVSYLLYSGETFTRFCFYHLDRKLLKYPFYRQPEQVLTALKIRFVKVIRLHLPLLGIVLAGLAVIYIIAGGRSLLDLALLSGLETVLMLFFSLHHLILYYLIQPFTESLKTKSFTYQAINGLVYWLSFHFYRIYEDTPLSFFWGSLIIMGLYVPIGLWAVMRFAPKRFRLRQ
ncbi:hypothetical protein [Streptococcus merionis]|uniref:ABC transporter, ATP binding protein n=1 Tax=Streptococcus merionis TaxID=400065 RepID=A0A239ST11_9STRE|nr:hypothetical protein [Streptococcus merionis]SNU88409.1 ABC transporter, ATP binding protein [Streptococcus merionis]